MSVFFMKLRNSATVPNIGTPGSVGYDLYYNEIGDDLKETEEIIIAPGETKSLGTGIAIQMPPRKGNFMMGARIFPRSGLATKKGIDVFAGLIDNDYHGEIKVVLFNSSNFPCIIEKNEKIAQIAFINFYIPTLVEVDNLDETQRGDGGFGSTGRFGNPNSNQTAPPRNINIPTGDTSRPSFVFNIFSDNPIFQTNRTVSFETELKNSASENSVNFGASNPPPRPSGGFGSGLSNAFGIGSSRQYSFQAPTPPPGFGFSRGNSNPAPNQGFSGFGNPNSAPIGFNVLDFTEQSKK